MKKKSEKVYETRMHINNQVYEKEAPEPWKFSMMGFFGRVKVSGFRWEGTEGLGVEILENI